MGVHKIKNNLNTSREKNQDTVIIKSKQNFNCVKTNSVAKVWNSLTILWVPPKGLGHFSSPTLCSQHRLPPKTRPVPFHGCCCSWQSLHGVGIVRIPGSLLQVSFIFTSSLSWLSSRTLAMPHNARPPMTFH